MRFLISDYHTVAELLAGRVSAGAQVSVRGWLRSKRDSKAGISFLAIHDGSAFDSVQAVVPNAVSADAKCGFTKIKLTLVDTDASADTDTDKSEPIWIFNGDQMSYISDAANGCLWQSSRIPFVCVLKVRH